MKKLYLLFLFAIFFTKAEAQWVTIPDANFAAFLQQQYPQCMNGNQIDTTCSGIVNETYLNCNLMNISDLSGIEHFKNLHILHCSGNNLISLPALPDSLYILYCHNNSITSLPLLPNNLTELLVSSNQLTFLDSLPSNLEKLYCDKNHVNLILSLPNTIKQFTCSNNSLTNLPPLPDSLIYLNVGKNLLATLPLLPNNLSVLYCDSNLISFIPNLPNSLTDVVASYNQLSSLPDLPSHLSQLNIDFNPLECLPFLDTITLLSIFNTNLQCVPNYSAGIGSSWPPITSFPICDIFNVNGCNVYWNISGDIFTDNNINCSKDSAEFLNSNLKVKLFSGNNLFQQVYSNFDGRFYFDTDTGTFTYTVDTTDLPVYVTCPSSGFHTSVLTPADSMDYNMDFAMQCKPGFDVGVKNIVRQTGQFFPANYATIKIGAGDMANFYGLTCASGISGSVIVDFTGPVSFISEAPGALVPVVNGNTLTYTVSDFSIVNFNSDFRIIVQTDTTAQAGDPVCFTVNVTPTTGDNDVSNNLLQHCFTVVNSFDPNAKEVYPEGGITPSHEWMTYTIHFQNTGNAPAQNIYILDSLDNNLIASSFSLLSYSHEPLVQLFGNVVKFNFPNINLPDSTNDEPNSHGFVQYKVKMVQGLPVGTVISNTAYNFFDFNPPVATNTVSNMVGVTSVANTNEKIELSVFPNPATDEINISFNLHSASEIKIELYNSLGQVVKTISKAKYEDGKILIRVSVADIPDGVYHLKATVNNQTTMRKIVKY